MMRGVHTSKCRVDDKSINEMNNSCVHRTCHNQRESFLFVVGGNECVFMKKINGKGQRSLELYDNTFH